jgi:large subunit ribosomal protein L4
MQGFTMRPRAALQGTTAITSPRPIAGKRGANARVAPVVPRAAAIDAVTFDGAKSSAATLELKTARAEVARGLVHKYVVMVRQNARRVRARATRHARMKHHREGAHPGKP